MPSYLVQEEVTNIYLQKGALTARTLDDTLEQINQLMTWCLSNYDKEASQAQEVLLVLVLFYQGARDTSGFINLFIETKLLLSLSLMFFSFDVIESVLSDLSLTTNMFVPI